MNVTVHLDEELMASLNDRVSKTLRSLGVSAEEKLSSAYLAARMDEEGITASGLADKCGVSRQYIYKVLRGEKPLSDQMIRVISDNTGISDAELCAVVAVQRLMESRNGSS